MKIKCLIFDFGNVIAFFEHREACRQLAELTRGKFSENDIYDDLFQEGGLEQQYDKGVISTEKFIKEIKRKFNIKASELDIKNAWCNIFSPNILMIELIQRLKNKNYKLILASNTNELHYNWFKNQFENVLSLFDDEVISFKVKSRKPEKDFFYHCVKKSGFQYSQCLFIDDRQDFMKIARDVGIRCIWYTSIDSFGYQLEELDIKDDILLENYSNLIILPRTDFINPEKDVALTIYREKYANFRHFDSLRWQIPGLVFLVAGAVMGFAPRSPDGYPAFWIFLLYGVFVLLCANLMARIGHNMKLNTYALQSIAIKLGDYSIPYPPNSRSAALKIVYFLRTLGIVCTAIGSVMGILILISLL